VPAIRPSYFAAAWATVRAQIRLRVPQVGKSPWHGTRILFRLSPMLAWRYDEAKAGLHSVHGGNGLQE
jgi:hypothetical protein